MKNALRLLIVLVGLALVAASCGGDTADTTTTMAATSAAPATTVVASTDAPVTTTAATTAAPETTTTATVETVAPISGLLQMTRIVFGSAAYIVVRNVGESDVELSTHWLCLFPIYEQLPALVVTPGDSVAIGIGDQPPPDSAGFAASVDIGAVFGTLSSGDGEMGLYTSPDFGSPTAIIDYVEWGSTGHERSGVAVEAGIWEAGAFIDIPVEAGAIASSGANGAGPGDWFSELGG